MNLPPSAPPVPHSPLESLIRARLKREGSLSVHDYMALCLHHPLYGYYRRGDPLGARGDFITAPEISQVFGEMLGIWIVSTWEKFPSQGHLTLIECGGGRGTLMADVLRTLRLFPKLFYALDVHMVEINTDLIALQKSALCLYPEVSIHWHERLEDVPVSSSFILLGNEFLDAFPVHQYQKDGMGWRERHVSLAADDTFTFSLARDDTVLPVVYEGFDAHTLPTGHILEYNPFLLSFFHRFMGLAQHTHHGVALLIDYGYTRFPGISTVQALQHHTPVSVFSSMGQVDLTALVDFSLLRHIALQCGALPSVIVPQRDFLLRLHIMERATALLPYLASSVDKEDFLAGVQRLIDPMGMGREFLCVAVVTPHALHLEGFVP